MSLNSNEVSGVRLTVQSENSHDGEVAVYMSGEFGLAGGGEERFRTEYHRRPQQVVTQWGQCLDTDWAEPRVVRVLQFDLYLMRLQSLTRLEKRRGAWQARWHHRLVNRLQRITVHSMTTHDFQCVQGLGAPTDDVTDVITDWQTGDWWVWHKHSNWRSATNIR